MPKIAKELSAKEVRDRAKIPGFHRVGGVTGLSLSVKPTKAASWVLRAKVGGKRRDLGLGSFPTVTLEMARQKAREMVMLISEGRDPLVEKQEAKQRLLEEQARLITFKDAAIDCHRKMAPEFRSKQHSHNWLRSLELYAFPKMGNVVVGAVQADPHILKVLEPIWFSKTDTAKRVRQRIETVLDWAAVKDLRDGPNPARWKGNLSHLLAKPSKIAKVSHRASLSWQDLPAFMRDLKQREGAGARALEFVIYTAARSGEVRQAVWDEIDLDNALWTVSGDRMKAGKEHRVPLNAGAVGVLRTVDIREGLVFRAPKGGALSDMSISAVCRRMKVDAVPHGFRSTFKDWCRANTKYSDEISELALAHVNSDATRAAYARDDLLEVRRELMEEWGQYCG